MPGACQGRASLVELCKSPIAQAGLLQTESSPVLNYAVGKEGPDSPAMFLNVYP